VALRARLPCERCSTHPTGRLPLSPWQFSPPPAWAPHRLRRRGRRLDRSKIYWHLLLRPSPLLCRPRPVDHSCLPAAAGCCTVLCLPAAHLPNWRGLRSDPPNLLGLGLRMHHPVRALGVHAPRSLINARGTGRTPWCLICRAPLCLYLIMTRPETAGWPRPLCVRRRRATRTGGVRRHCAGRLSRHSTHSSQSDASGAPSGGRAAPVYRGGGCRGHGHKLTPVAFGVCRVGVCWALGIPPFSNRAAGPSLYTLFLATSPPAFGLHLRALPVACACSRAARPPPRSVWPRALDCCPATNIVDLDLPV